MILFVFEGEDREPHVYKTLERLFFPKDNNNIICSFRHNIYELYNQIAEYDGNGDIVSIIRERLVNIGDSTLDNIRSTDISEIFLFFDYDFHNSQLPLEEINRRVKKMLSMFNDETDNGKLYINYPMVESIRFTQELPDDRYPGYIVSRTDCTEFKQLAHNFSYYKDFDHILFKEGTRLSKDKYMTIRDNWRYLTEMNVCKANLLVSGNHSIPEEKSTINQLDIFISQCRQYVNTMECVSILNAFPLFIFDYLRWT